MPPGQRPDSLVNYVRIKGITFVPLIDPAAADIIKLNVDMLCADCIVLHCTCTSFSIPDAYSRIFKWGISVILGSMQKLDSGLDWTMD